MGNLAAGTAFDLLAHGDSITPDQSGAGVQDKMCSIAGGNRDQSIIYTLIIIDRYGHGTLGMDISLYGTPAPDDQA